MKRLEGKVAVVTGGNSGIGLATAKQFRDEGAHVVISGRSQKTLDDAAKELGKDALVVQADVSKLGDADKLFSAVEKRFGKIDVLFVNAGVAKFVPLDQVSPDLVNATVAAEDAGFWKNPGVSLTGLARAAYENLAFWKYGGFFKGSGGRAVSGWLGSGVQVKTPVWASIVAPAGDPEPRL